MPWKTSDIPNLTGRTALVTGGNSGLGLASSRALAGAGAHVILGVRDDDKGKRTLATILESHPSASLEFEIVDLASQEGIRQAADQILSRRDSLDILMNNAGLMAVPDQRTEDGYEMQIGVNHLGHWSLTGRLLPLIIATPGARVVTVTSLAHHWGRPVDPNDVHMDEGYSPWTAYGRSKLANFHFGLGLDRRFRSAGTDASSLIAHPGFTDTDLYHGPPGGDFSIARQVGMSPSTGALPQLRAATDPDADGGEMYAPRFLIKGAAVRRPILRRLGLARAIDRLWEISATETGIEVEPGAVGQPGSQSGKGQENLVFGVSSRTSST